MLYKNHLLNLRETHALGKKILPPHTALQSLQYSAARSFRTLKPQQEEQALREKEEMLSKTITRDLLGASTNISSTFNAVSEDYPHIAKETKAKPKSITTPSWLSWIFLLYSILFLLIQPNLDQLSGVPWWTTTPELVAVWILFSLTLSSKEKNTIQSEYSTLAVSSSFLNFLAADHPMLFSGENVSQSEILAALGACYAYSGDRDFMQKLSRVSRLNDSSRAKIDSIMTLLKSEYPRVFGKSLDAL